MIIPSIFLYDDHKGLTDSYGNQLEKEQLIYIKNKLEEVLQSKNGHLQKEGYVYFVKDVNDLIKIGCTEDFNQRKHGLKSQFGNLELIRLLKCNDMISLERYFHIIFKKNRVTGEWFGLNVEIVNDYILGETELQFEAEDVEIV